MKNAGAVIGNAKVLAARPARNPVDPSVAYHSLVEPERNANGKIVNTATVFLTNRECPFRCVMCDLWKNTTLKTPPVGTIPQQIELALAELPAAEQIKLYNSGNFFDAAAFPKTDRAAVAKLVSGFQNVIVENHPRLCGPEVLEFQQALENDFEIAMGLETSHAETLRRLNKQMTLDDFASSCDYLLRHGIQIRAFILLRPPWTNERDGIHRAIESIRFAFDCGVSCCAVIPTRAGNGIMDQLQAQGDFSPPALSSLETVMQTAVAWQRGRVLADLWDLQLFSSCDHCLQQRQDRLQEMNLRQCVLPAMACDACHSGSVS